MTKKQSKVPKEEINEVVEETIQQHLTQCLDLLKPGVVENGGLDVRSIYLINGNVVFGVILSETHDSFLVGSCVKLVMDEDKSVYPQPMSPMSVIRMFKASIVLMSGASDQYKYHYYKYLSSKRGIKTLPDIMNGIVLEQVLEYTQAYEADNEAEAAGRVIVPETLSQTFARQGVPGVSNFAFEPYEISKAVN